MQRYLARQDILITILLFLLAIPAEYFELFSLLEEQTLSVRQILRMRFGDPEQTGLSKEVVLVNTDEAFYKEYGSYPLRRTDIGRISENLKKLGARVVAIDMLMDFPSSYGEDPETAASFRKSDPVLLVAQADYRDGAFVRLNRPTPELAAVAASGYTNISSASAIITSLSRLKVDPEIVRREDGWPFAVQALALYLDVKPQLRDGHLVLGPKVDIRLDQFDSLYIDFPALHAGNRFLSQQSGISALEFLDLANLDEDELEELRYWVDGRIVLVGDTSEVSHDWFDTPVGMVYGVEIIASTIHTILHGAFLRAAGLGLEAAQALLLMILVLQLIRIVHPVIRTLAALALSGLYVIVALWLYVYFGLILSMSYVLIAFFLSFFAISHRFYLMEINQKKEIKGAFGQYLSPKVVDILVKDPSRLSLGGESRHMTAFFFDIAGFSKISEQLTPEGLVHLLNVYLTAMCDIIAQFDGTVDKFSGDAIVAFWGAPLEQPDHARLACFAAIDMQQRMEIMRAQLAQEGMPSINVRMGLNTGEMVVGNMGSRQRMDYTIMGDAVNLASRLEGANKFFGTDTMISDATFCEVRDVVEARELDVLRVVGKVEPVTVYQLLARKGELGGNLARILPVYARGYADYRARNFTRAIERFREALAIVPDDGPSLTHLNRCRTYLRNPPPEEWDGVFQLTSKG